MTSSEHSLHMQEEKWHTTAPPTMLQIRDIWQPYIVDKHGIDLHVQWQMNQEEEYYEQNTAYP